MGQDATDWWFPWYQTLGFTQGLPGFPTRFRHQKLQLTGGFPCISKTKNQVALRGAGFELEANHLSGGVPTIVVAKDLGIWTGAAWRSPKVDQLTGGVPYNWASSDN